ncbi:hypothetical protein BKA66DRAFT_448049 [Pyrenochaeta sp. MPI-SDFR-AT-0127]|nr:hypothetical protein BKA66DRAFT_448049 [Pyrenochaeta sp. MPI-SDFR-AT-0127]
MRLTISILPFLGQSVLAAKWSIDGSCDLVGIADPGNGLDPFLMATDELKMSMNEAITMAENAFNVMKDHAGDRHVSDMLKLALGEGAEYQSKFDAVKETFERVMAFEKEYAAGRPLDKIWQDTMTNDDVMVFCSNDHIKKDSSSSSQTKYYLDTSMKNTRYVSVEMDPSTKRMQCHTVDYDIGNIKQGTMAFTTRSDFFNKDVIAQTQQPGFKGGITSYALPVDGLRNLGLSMLHELTHTKQGGQLLDVRDLPSGVLSCYGWKCIQELKDPQNADNVAMLGLALHLWTMGYYVDKDGNVNSK